MSYYASVIHKNYICSNFLLLHIQIRSFRHSVIYFSTFFQRPTPSRWNLVIKWRHDLDLEWQLVDEPKKFLLFTSFVVALIITFDLSIWLSLSHSFSPFLSHSLSPFLSHDVSLCLCLLFSLTVYLFFSVSTTVLASVSRSL
jgi:hypothetical protein